eukprot:TRINITY_DN49166_c0_g1_i1.p1 TRINITY_DN49166_c0_g1~~TRINITY_DN49166_c0_g1_i1.p1  ORF type:complete len:423 (-),score=54.08 TRINITY_DN49166_c0_g1_i1:764-2032(-)
MRVLVFLLFLGLGLGDNFLLGRPRESCESACGLHGRACMEYIGAPPQQSFARGCEGPGPFVVIENKCHTMRNTTCSMSPEEGSRICKCGDDITNQYFFGTGLSSGHVNKAETPMFSHAVADGNIGVMTHFWSTAPNGVEAGVTIRYYVDGEKTASVAFTPSMASGVGFNDNQAPRGTKWLGIGAGNGHGQAWWNNYRIPFKKNITVTTQKMSGTSGGFFMIVRGKMIPAPPTFFKLHLVHYQQSEVPPLQWVPAVSLSSSSLKAMGAAGGYIFQHTLAVASGNENFLEGCYHAYTPYTAPFPGIVLSTGTEDYYDSGWYFNAGEFMLPVSGFTHRKMSKNLVTWSAYRFHEMDPLRFGASGIRYEWRNGDEVDPKTGIKCLTESGGRVVGSPTKSNVTAYTWVYLCESTDESKCGGAYPWDW